MHAIETGELKREKKISNHMKELSYFSLSFYLFYAGELWEEKIGVNAIAMD